MSALALIVIGNLLFWGVIVGLMFVMAARERELVNELGRLEKRLSDRE